MRRAQPSVLRLVFDASRCDGYGMCSLICPERISLDTWGFAHVDDEPVSDRSGRRRALRAARCCPRGALGLEEISGISPGPAQSGTRVPGGAEPPQPQ